MRGVARISFQGGGLILPAKTPYDRELLWQHVEAYAKRHGHINVEINHREWSVTLTDDAAACAGCSRQLERLLFSFAGRIVCGQCARHQLR